MSGSTRGITPPPARAMGGVLLAVGTISIIEYHAVVIVHVIKTKKILHLSYIM